MEDPRCRDARRVVLLRQRPSYFRLDVVPFLAVHACALACAVVAFPAFVAALATSSSPDASAPNATENGTASVANSTTNSTGDDGTVVNELGAVWLAQMAAVPLAVAAHAIAWLATYWSIGWRCAARYRAAGSLASATHVRVDPLPHRGRPEVCAVVRPPQDATDNQPYFLYQKSKYIWNEERQRFEVLEYPSACEVAWYASQSGHRTAETVAAASARYGKNTFDVPPATFWVLYREHAVAPFFVFQMACVALWALDEHPQYALLMLFMLLFSPRLQSKYIWNEERQRFEVLEYPSACEVAWYASQSGHRTAETVAAASARYGKNTFDVPPATFWVLYREHAVAPFFVFQMACVALWALDEHPQYALLMLFMLLVFEATVVQSRLRNGAALRAMLEREAEDVYVLRLGTWRRIPAADLTPGDVVSVTRTPRAAVDSVLLCGGAVVNEAMLTGESTPHLKESIDSTDTAHLDDSGPHKVNVVFAGTEVIHAAYGTKSPLIPRPPDGGCPAYVLRTGFETSQGKLVRTIAFASEHTTAASGESIAFIAFLLVFALAASAYVLNRGLSDPRRSRWKLVVECSLIITSVVPPELPMELSLAVNTSLLALRRLGIFCTEPFRIPYAGKVSVCCFDKTGTLTCDSVRFSGIAQSLPSTELTLAPESSETAQIVLAGCHSLAHAPGGAVVGDPAETVAIKAVGWSLPHKEPGTARKGSRTIRIVHRWPFSSQLRRMATAITATVGAQQRNSAGPQVAHYIAAKGAPEAIKPLLQSVPEGYDSCCRKLARDGGRVMALAYRVLSEKEQLAVVQQGREAAEHGLVFAGFAVFESPAKPDAGECVVSLRNSSHTVVMITGDHVLTSCHVAKALRIVHRELLIASRGEGGAVVWTRYESDESSTPLPRIEKPSAYDLCVPGDVLDDFLSDANAAERARLLPRVRVFARASPEQKERVVSAFRATGHCVLMCGDGTNDVGALKQADVGIALLNVSDAPRPQQQQAPQPAQGRPAPKTFAQMLEEAQKQTEENAVAGLGDASVASPFTSRASSPAHGVTHVLAQGRATLAATTQVYRVLSLNCLISAYTLSVLYFEGVQLGEKQATVFGMLVAVCFMFVSRSHPPVAPRALPQLSRERPVTSFFHPTVVVSVVLQSTVHLLALFAAIALVRAEQKPDDKPADPDAPFAPSLLNSVVFLVSCAMQASTFAVNHRGRPFTTNLTENKGLLVCLGAMMAIALGCAMEVSPEWNSWLELTPLPSAEFRARLVAVAVADVALSWLCDRVVMLVGRIACGKARKQRC
eukprot:m51a1_g2944 putative probable cation-transporting atpase 13a1-like (1288) ;mRNA; f:607116-611357